MIFGGGDFTHLPVFIFAVFGLSALVFAPAFCKMRILAEIVQCDEIVKTVLLKYEKVL